MAPQRADKLIGTLIDAEKGRGVFAKQIRRRTRASLFCGKASNAAENSMFSAAFFILLKYLQLFFTFFMLAVDRLFRQSEKTAAGSLFSLSMEHLMIKKSNQTNLI